MHEGVPWFELHVLPQAPQLETLARFASHPLAALPSQFAKPPTHVSEQTPPPHDGVAFAPLQTLPHAPQFERLASVFVSQPFVATWSQSPKPAAHDCTWQTPVGQVPVAFAGLHVLPQLPQFAVVCVLVSQPSAGLPLQSAQPELHDATPHVVPVHAAVPFAVVHLMPQPPQLFTSSWMTVSHPLPALPSQLP